MEGNNVASVDSATQTSDFGSDDDEEFHSLHEMGNSSPRVVVDTSPPFGSVEEAVIRFGGRGFWIPHSLVTANVDTATVTVTDTDDKPQIIDPRVPKLDNGIAAMLKDLQKKEQETQEIMRELELTKRLVEELKQKLSQEAHTQYMNKHPVAHSPNNNNSVSSNKSGVCPVDRFINEPINISSVWSNRSGVYPVDHSTNNNLVGSNRSGVLLTDHSVNNNPVWSNRSGVFSVDHSTDNNDPVWSNRSGVFTVDHSTNEPINKTEEHQNTIPSSSIGVIMMELKQAKHNLYQNTHDLAELRASVEALSKKIDKENAISSPEKAKEITMIGSINPLAISRELRELNYEAEQFMKTAEKAKSEVLKAMSDVEKTKIGLKVTEMRWVVAKKLEDAARAAENLALEEIKALSSTSRCSPTNVESEGDKMYAALPLPSEGTTGVGLFDQGNYQQKQGRISLSFEEYSALTEKARKGESMIKRREMDGFKKIEEEFDGKTRKMGGLRNSFSTRPIRRDSRLLNSSDFEFDRIEGKPVRRGTTSIGDILSRKLVLREDVEVEENCGERMPRVSLNQMLRRHRGETNSSPKRRGKEGNNEGKSFFFSKRKGFGFVHISLPLSKQNKNNKIQALNLWGREYEKDGWRG